MTASTPATNLCCNPKRRHPKRRCRGAAAAELAICLPLIVFLLLASLEACSMIFLDHSLTIASYEGVRMGINYDGSNSQVIARCNQVIASRNVEGATISISPANVATVARGTPIRITVSAPCEDNALLPLWFYNGKTLSSSTTMVKE